MASNSRAPIPEHTKRQVRQECYFGCVLCGAPVFHYDHIEEYSVVNEHKAGNLALLCERHHGAKTTGKLSADRVMEARKTPYNKERVLSSGWQQEASRKINIDLAGNYASCTLSQEMPVHHVIWNTGFTYVALHWSDGWYSISAVLTDDRGQPLVVIYEGELRVFSQVVWDYVYEGTTIKVRAGLGIILLDMTWSDNEFIVTKGRFLNPFGDGFVAHNNGLITVVRGQMAGMSVGCGAYENGFGAWGINNSKYFPTEQCPKGFGFFRNF
ncbi:HNH endonuclease [Agrobacterium tumefaciens]|nr:HNH endonuclease [Agrobacterium tumefaciens]